MSRPIRAECSGPRASACRRSQAGQVQPSGLRTGPEPATSGGGKCSRSVNAYVNGVRSTTDKAGRLVIPKTLRDSLGLVPGEVEITPARAGLHIEPLADDRLEDEDGLLVIPAAGATVSDNLVRTLRDLPARTQLCASSDRTLNHVLGRSRWPSAPGSVRLCTGSSAEVCLAATAVHYSRVKGKTVCGIREDEGHGDGGV